MCIRQGLSRQFQKLRKTEKISIVVAILYFILYFVCSKAVLGVIAIGILITLNATLFTEMLYPDTSDETKNKNFFMMLFFTVYIISLMIL